MESILDIPCRILVFGHSAMLGELASDLRVSPLLHVIEQEEVQPLDAPPHVILVDAAQSTAEQFRQLIPLCPTILSVDLETRQMNVLCSPPQADLAEMARVIEKISLILQSPA